MEEPGKNVEIALRLCLQRPPESRMDSGGRSFARGRDRPCAPERRKRGLASLRDACPPLLGRSRGFFGDASGSTFQHRAGPCGRGGRLGRAVCGQAAPPRPQGESSCAPSDHNRLLVFVWHRGGEPRGLGRTAWVTPASWLGCPVGFAGGHRLGCIGDCVRRSCPGPSGLSGVVAATEGAFVEVAGQDP